MDELVDTLIPHPTATA